MKKKIIHCAFQDNCNLLEIVTAQYNAVLAQNASLQKTVIWQKEEMDKDNNYLMKLEEANMLFEQDIEVLKLQVNVLKQELMKYKQAIKKVDGLAQKEIQQ